MGNWKIENGGGKPRERGWQRRGSGFHVHVRKAVYFYKEKRLY